MIAYYDMVILIIFIVIFYLRQSIVKHNNTKRIPKDLINIFDQIKNNIKHIKNKIGDTRFGFVLKHIYPIVRFISNSYGYTMIFELAKYVEEYVDIFYVANISDAICLREAGIRKRIMVLYLIDPSKINQIIEYDLEIIVPSIEWLDLIDIKVIKNRRIKTHLWLNSNLGKEGANTTEEVITLYRKLKQIPYIKIVGLGTKYNTSDESYFNSLKKLKSIPTDLIVQHNVFSDLVKRINDPDLMIHTACTFEMTRNFTESYFGSKGCVRVGGLIYRDIIWEQDILDIRSAKDSDCYGYYCEKTKKRIKEDRNFHIGMVKNYLSLQIHQMDDLKIFDTNGNELEIILVRYDPIIFILNNKSNQKIGSKVIFKYNDLFAYK